MLIVIFFSHKKRIQIGIEMFIQGIVTNTEHIFLLLYESLHVIHG